MAKFQNSKFEIQKRRFKIQKAHAYTPHAHARAPAHCTGNVIAAPRLGGHRASPVVLVRVALALWRSHAPSDGVGAFMRDYCGLQGESEGKDFLLFPLKWGEFAPIPFVWVRLLIITRGAG